VQETAELVEASLVRTLLVSRSGQTRVARSRALVALGSAVTPAVPSPLALPRSRQALVVA